MQTKYLRFYHFITFLLKELPFYDELNIVKNKSASSGYARSYEIEIVDKRDVVVHLRASEISIRELFKDILIELKVFKYQITLAILLSKIVCTRKDSSSVM